MKILSADDSSIIRKMIRGGVKEMGYEFLEAENGMEVLELLEKHDDIALILLDWNMPVMDGFNALKKIKENPKYQDIPVMMVTTESERDNIVKAIQAGAKNYVTKPFKKEDLISKMLDSLGMGSGDSF